MSGPIKKPIESKQGRGSKKDGEKKKCRIDIHRDEANKTDKHVTRGGNCNKQKNKAIGLPVAKGIKPAATHWAIWIQ